MKLVLDTNILVAGLRSRTGASNALLAAGFRDRYQWCCSLPLFYEYEEVLNRAEFLLGAGLTRETIGKFMKTVALTVVPVEINFRWRPQLTDPDDEMVLETAINARATAIVTHNARDFGAVPVRFGMQLLAPSDALRRVKP